MPEDTQAQPLPAYKDLKQHMAALFLRPRQTYAIDWKKTLLCSVNALGNPIANFEGHFVEARTKASHSFVQACAAAAGSFVFEGRCGDEGLGEGSAEDEGEECSAEGAAGEEI